MPAMPTLRAIKEDQITTHKLSTPDAPCRPATGEFDLMQYYQDTLSSKDMYRSVAAEKAVLGLLWLSKVKSV